MAVVTAVVAAVVMIKRLAAGPDSQACGFAPRVKFCSSRYMCQLNSHRIMHVQLRHEHGIELTNTQLLALSTAVQERDAVLEVENNTTYLNPHVALLNLNLLMCWCAHHSYSCSC